jgi:Rad3-related DNA helicase
MEDFKFDNDGRIIVPGAERPKTKLIDRKIVWSLYKTTERVDNGEETLGNSLFDYSGDKLEPLKFSNGKTQADVVNEVLDAIDKGNKIIFINGFCGSGKSAIALNIAKHFKKTSIVVPIKSLQEQYEMDYTHKNFILTDENKKLRISVLKGRNNFDCLYCKGCKADDELLPCTIELREKNFDKILEYIDDSKDFKRGDFSTITDVRRVSVASTCPYWSPLLSSETSGKVFSKAKKKKYAAVNGKDYAVFERTSGCKYYQQYDAYFNSDVFIFNSQKYLLEMAIGRKPKTDLEIIDECDEFLDNFANEKKINLNRLVSSIANYIPEERKDVDVIKDIIFLANKVINAPSERIEKLNDSILYDLFRKILDNPYLVEGEDGNYYNSVFEAVKSFEDLVEECYVSFEVASSGQSTLFGKSANTVYVNLVSINVAKRFQDIIEANNVLVLMSGTLHSANVLKDIFGLNEFKIIDAETKKPGQVIKYRTGFEKNCKYENFKSGLFTRKDYLTALSKCVEHAKNPCLVHVSSFGDLPTDLEKKQFDLNNLISKEDLFRLQERPGQVESFKRKEIDLLFTTKCARGVDFPGDQCNSIILTKYPYPNIQGLFWQILKKERPDKFMEFYLDKARREMIQKIYRGVRFKEDHVLLLSPDSRVLDANLN